MQVVPPLLSPHRLVLLLSLLPVVHEPERAPASGKERAASANAAAATATELELPLGWRLHGLGRLLPITPKTGGRAMDGALGGEAIRYPVNRSAAKFTHTYAGDLFTPEL